MSLWTKIDEKTLEMLEKQRSLEERTAKRIEELYVSISNPVARLYLHSIMLDTQKHADMYQIVIDLNTRALLGEANKEKMRNELLKHVSEERDMLIKAKKLSKSLEDLNFKSFIERIVEDEEKHHNILKELFQIIENEGEDWSQYFYELIKDYP